MDSVTPHIRRATARDVPSLVALMTAFYGESDVPLPTDAATRAFHDLFERPELGCVLIAEQEGAAIGHLVLIISWSMEFGGHRGFIDDLYVRRDARRHGVGSALLFEAEREARTRGVRTLLVEVGADNDRALGVYRAAGFAETTHRLLSRPLAAPLHEQ